MAEAREMHAGQPAVRWVAGSHCMGEHKGYAMVPVKAGPMICLYTVTMVMDKREQVYNLRNRMTMCIGSNCMHMDSGVLQC